MNDSEPADRSRELVTAAEQACAERSPVYVSAGGSKREILGRHCEARLLDVSGHRGIVDYHSDELVITARAGTPLTDIASSLAEQGQLLAFDPPLFGGRATLGGTLACNLSGPARPWSGSIRDAVLGVQLINGRGELLNFGGKVMKNVAGYDASRLQAGALGTLGIISQVSLRTLPRHEHSLSLTFEMSAQEAIDSMNRRAGEARSLNGAYWVDGRLYLRLAGTANAVDHTARLWGGEVLPEEAASWNQLREMTLPFFSGDAPLWRFSVKSSAPFNPAFGESLIDWCGAQRWVRGEHDQAAVHAAAAMAGGHAGLFRGGDRQGDLRQPLNPVEQGLQRRLKQAFDPEGIFNPGRLYSWM